MSGRRIIVGLLTGALALPLAGCGGGGPKIPRGDAQQLIAQLRNARAQADAKQCSALEGGTLADLRQRVDGLPQKVDKDIRDSLQEGISNLQTLVQAQCATKKPKPKSTTTTTTSTPTTTTTTTPTTTTSTPTTSSTTTSRTTTSSAPPTSSAPSGGTSPGKGNKGAKGKKAKKVKSK